MCPVLCSAQHPTGSLGLTHKEPCIMCFCWLLAIVPQLLAGFAQGAQPFVGDVHKSKDLVAALQARCLCKFSLSTHCTERLSAPTAQRGHREGGTHCTAKEG